MPVSSYERITDQQFLQSKFPRICYRGPIITQHSPAEACCAVNASIWPNREPTPDKVPAMVSKSPKVEDRARAEPGNLPSAGEPRDSLVKETLLRRRLLCRLVRFTRYKGMGRGIMIKKSMDEPIVFE
jgi:hypothetical protein